MTVVRDVMTADPVVLRGEQTAGQAAAVMRDLGVGAVLVADDTAVRGLVTDRDIVVRAIADGRGPETPLAEVCTTSGLVTVDASEDVAAAERLMRDNAVRRLPVVDNGRVAGVVSLGDVAAEIDGDSALGRIRGAEPNN